MRRAEKTRRQAVEDGVGHAARTGSGDESAVQDAADARAHTADRHEEGSAASSTSSAEQRGVGGGGQHRQAVTGHLAEGYSEREGGRYIYVYIYVSVYRI